MENRSQPPRVHKKVYEQLRNLVIQGFWKPGDKVPSPENLSAELHSSPGSIRRVLKRLVAMGFLENRPRDGIYVRTLGENQFAGALFPFLAYEQSTIVQVLEYRWLIEKGAASIAAKKATEADIKDLESAYKKMESAQDSIETFARFDLEFHLALARASHNPIIARVNSTVKEILEASVLELVSCLGMNDALFYHERILQAVKDHNRKEAERWMEEHIGRTIRRYLERDGNAGDDE